MQTDKELLGLAAKAACIQIGAYAEQIDSYYSEWDGQSAYELTTGGYWNPLIDDGDALRLAVKLCLTVDVRPWAVCIFQGRKQFLTFGKANGNDDLMRSTRRAIVSAAAEIGKAMP